jgi:tRNA pseudouridine32 synthase/23S rRNA pseudouridine746 synthase
LNHFQNFKTTISEIQLPEKFTFPFYYEPHTLAKIATKELQDYLEGQTDFKHDFGLNSTNSKLPIGKMFGVLVVKNQQNEIGYLAAFSGKLADKSLPNKFVPPIFNMRTEGSFYIKGEKEIEEIGEEISILKKDRDYVSLKKSLKKMKKIIEDDLAFQRKKMKSSKLERRFRKKNEGLNLDSEQFEVLTKQLVQESFNDQFFYKELQEYYEGKIEKRTNNYSILKIVLQI